MRQIYVDKIEIDNRAYEKYGISNLILMENAGGNLARFIYKKQKKDSKIIFLCGGGNNGADGLVAARILDAMNHYKIKSKLKVAGLKTDSKIIVIMMQEPKSELCKMHFDIIQKLDIKIIMEYKEEKQEESLLDVFKILSKKDIVVDCIFGSGFDSKKKSSPYIHSEWFHKYDFEFCKALKIACDMPSGLPNKLENSSEIEYILGKVDYTIAMGTINLSLLDSRIKDIVGKIKIVHIGLESSKYNVSRFDADYPYSNMHLLTKKDLKLPYRIYQNNNKGNFGTAYIFGGETFGASLISAKAALNFGAGKVCIYEGILKQKHTNKDCEIIYTDKIAYTNVKEANQKNRAFITNTSIAIGMGLSYDESQYEKIFSFLEDIAREYCIYESLLKEYRLKLNDSTMSENTEPINSAPKFIFDADILYRKELANILPKLKGSIVTPHPKEFLALLQNLDSKNAPKDMQTLLASLPQISQNISQKYSGIIFLIKDTNTVIAHSGKIYINNLGKSNLAKGGSGDVLSGLIASLLAQGYDSLESCVQASLAHSIASKKALKKYSSYALTPNKLIKVISEL